MVGFRVISGKVVASARPTSSRNTLASNGFQSSNPVICRVVPYGLTNAEADKGSIDCSLLRSELLFHSFAAFLGRQADGRAISVHLTEEPSTSPPIAPLERLTLVTAYFGVSAIGIAISAVATTAGILFPQLGISQPQPDLGNPWLNVALLALLTFGFARTCVLLRRRRRSGAIPAGVLLGAWLSTALWDRTFTWSLAIPAIGILFLAAAWRHLDADV
jgi:hypothetical protein